MKTIQYIINRFGLRAGFRVKSYLDICFVLHTIVFDSLATVQLALWKYASSVIFNDLYI